MTDEVVMRHQLLQKLDLMVKYAQLPLKNEKGERVQPDFYKQMKRLMISYNDDRPEDNFVLVPPPPPPIPEKVKEDKPKITFSFKAEDLANPLVQMILIETAKDDGVIQFPKQPGIPIGPQGPNNPQNMRPKDPSINIQQQVSPQGGNLSMEAGQTR